MVHQVWSESNSIIFHLKSRDYWALFNIFETYIWNRICSWKKIANNYRNWSLFLSWGIPWDSFGGYLISGIPFYFIFWFWYETSTTKEKKEKEKNWASTKLNRERKEKRTIRKLSHLLRLERPYVRILLPLYQNVVIVLSVNWESFAPHFHLLNVLIEI